MTARRHKPLELPCLKCGKWFFKKVSEIRKTSNHFCSRSCAASYNNATSAKRTVEGECQQCGAPISRRNVYCAKCRASRAIENQSLADAICLSNKASKYCRVREHARKLYKHITACELCGYDKHVEICHIKPLSSFDLTVLVSEVNKRSNIAILCPNCHWELDEGMLSL